MASLSVGVYLIRIFLYVLVSYNVQRMRPNHNSFFFFDLEFTALQDYFTHFKPCQSVGAAKTGDPREKTSDHPQAELRLSHM